MNRPVQVPDDLARGIGRRGLLTGMGAIAAAGLLGGCGSGGGDGARRFRAAFAAGGSQETMDPHVAPNFVDQVRAKAMFDTLATFGDDMSIRPRLAESWESDASGKRWRVRLREARFHDGAPVTAEDVLFTYRRVADPGTGSPSQQLMSAVDFAASGASGPRELTLVLKEADFGFPRALAGVGTEVLPTGTTSFRNPVGSGPFRFGSFTPGGPALFKRWDGHWDTVPRVAELEIVPANEEAARVNALLSGQVHYAADLAGAAVNRLKGEKSARLLSAPRATAQQILLSRGREPFSDLRLVEAFQLGIDRAALARIALAGQGEPGNDLFGKGLDGYPADLPPRERDADRARALVREAGADGLEVPLQTSTLDAAWEPAAALIARQLGEIGLKVVPHTLAAPTYFSEMKERRSVAAFNTTSTLPVTTFLEQRLRGGAARNLTGFASGEFDELLDRARTTRDDAARAELLHRAQRIARDESGLVVWGFSDANDAISADVRGLRAAPPNSHDWARFDRVALG
ncbi:ABC transporter substrate-binding protein [Actinomadura sp. WMMB 499]|uniref:ABC transporter substrate-binding protein n=1 Tax=Actinomadura sp. WMMB 499 TaxID=1219491 RepID=UPI00124474E3|nr:ABC transporter substrate-binding protein [Actinomadura sp. WMMB 499]QFG26187.1 ABC transporter substrate-binding protein [Actinomadura sp. WMMB 499]